MNTNKISDPKQIEQIIAQAMKKIEAEKETDICRYIPGESGGYIHHFTFRKMKTESPQQLFDSIKRYIIDPSTPVRVPHKPRAPRGSHKHRDEFVFSREDVEKLRQMARKYGERDMVRRLTMKEDLRAIRKKLLNLVQRYEVDEELWYSYCEAIAARNQTHYFRNGQQLSAAETAAAPYTV